jgi:hypothetical protein
MELRGNATLWLTVSALSGSRAALVTVLVTPIAA